MVGIINLKWHKACAVRGMGFTKDERAAGWPESFALERLAILQSPGDKKMANILHRALKDACAASLPSAPTTVRKIGFENRLVRGDTGFVRRNIYGERELAYREQNVPVMKAVETPAVTAADFAAWLAAQGEKPSEHVAGWFAAVGVSADAGAATPQPAEPVASESKEDRQDRRLQLCLDAGLEMPNSAVGRMPYGIGKVAEQEGVTRQTFTDDVKAALARKIERERPKPMLVPKRR